MTVFADMWNANGKKTWLRYRKTDYFFIAASSSSFLAARTLRASTFVLFVSASDTEHPEGLEFMFCICDGVRCSVAYGSGIASVAQVVAALLGLLMMKCQVDKSKTHRWIAPLCSSSLAGEYNKPLCMLCGCSGLSEHEQLGGGVREDEHMHIAMRL